MMEIVEGGYIRRFPKNQRFHFGDIVVAVKTKTPQDSKGGEFYEANKQYKVYDVMQCHNCGEEYIHINPGYGHHHQSYCNCSKCNEDVYVDNKLWSNANDFRTLMELRKVKLEQIKYNKLSLFGKLNYKIKKVLKIV